MPIVSGLILDIAGRGVNQANIYAVTYTGIFSQGVTLSNGYFELTTPSSGSVTYSIFKENYISYSKTLPAHVSNAVFYIRETTSIPTIISGYINCYNSCITTATTARNIINTPLHLFAITEGGLDIIDKITNSNKNFINYSGGFTSIALDTSLIDNIPVYLGTSNSGVYKLNYTDTYVDRDISNQINPLYNINNNNISSNNVRSLHITDNNLLAIGTNSGIDTYSGNYRYTHNYPLETTNCKLTNLGKLYYTPVGSGLYVQENAFISNWIEPSYKVLLSGTGNPDFPLPSNYINDLAIVTATGNLNTVFIGTTSGMLAYKEELDLNISASNSTILEIF